MGRGSSGLRTAPMARRSQPKRLNPLLSAYQEVMAARDRGESYADQQAQVRSQYAFAVPTAAALSAIAQLGPIVEFGAGSGYWASLLADRGVDVRALDLAPPADGANDWTGRQQYYPIEQADATALRQYGKRTLLLCWPPYDSPMASEALQHWSGDTLAFIGEGPYGATANEAFFTTLEDEFELIKRVDLPNWPICRDDLTIWRRR